MDDKRNAPRHRVIKAATVAFHGGGITCRVRNLSDSGAALDVASPIGIPDQFDLVMDGEQSGRHCRIVWRKEKQIGIAFL